MMNEKPIKNIVLVSIIAILLGTTVVPIVNTNDIYRDSIPKTEGIVQFSNSGNILYVGGTGPNNYTKIQDAIDNASNGDTVFVYDDSSPYYENVVVNKSINLKGENRDTAVIDGNGSDVVYVSADWVNISAFTLRNGGFGINIHSDYNTISGNNISNNWYGIFLDDSSNTISGNNISSSDRYGIFLRSSNNNTISGNNISSNGIYLYHSSNNNISDNSFFNDGLFVYYSYQNNVYNNTVNGKPLVYLEGDSDKVIDYAGQVTLIKCDNITVQNQELSNTRIGVQLWSSDNCLIFGNNISSNVVGIDLDYSSNNIISNNVISDSEAGISLYSSDNNNISGNKILNNSWCGIRPDVSDYNSISSNDISNNDEGIRLIGSCYSEISGNNIISNKEGVILHHWSSHNNTISGNNIISNHYGIWTPGGSNNTIFGNNIISNDYGIDLESPLNVIKYNNFMGNSRDAIFMTFRFSSNHWYRNYWDDWPGLIPRPIFGMVILSFYPPLGIPWMNFDWCPLIKPYGGE